MSAQRTLRIAVALTSLASPALPVPRPAAAIGAVGSDCPDFDLRFAAPRTDSIRALAVFDGGGGARLFSGSSNPPLAEWNGERWAPVVGQAGGPISGEVRALLVHDFGAGPELVVAGTFASTGGGTLANVARFDGTSWSPLGAGLDGTVHALAAFDDGSGPRVVAAGSFTGSGATPLARIAVFDGSAWTPLGAGLDAPARAVAAFDFGSGARLVAGGEFLHAGGVAANFVASWNGTSWSALPGGVDGEVRSLLARGTPGAQTILVGGALRHAGGAPASLVASFDGANWSTFGPGLDPASVFDGSVNALLADGAGFVAGGRFETFAPPASRSTNVARWNGSAWEPLASGVGVPLYVGVDALARFDAGDGAGARVFAAGSFLPQTGQPTSIARFDGARWKALRDDDAQGLVHDPGQEGASSAEMWQGELVLAGEFDGVASASDAYGIARWDGATWRTMGTSPARAYLDHPTLVRAVDLGAGPELLLGMTRYETHDARVPVYRWNGAAWAPLAAGTLPALTSTMVLDVAVFDDGGGPALFAGGQGLRPTAGSAPDAIARFRAGAWTSLGSGGSPAVGGTIARLLVHDDGAGSKLYAGGNMPGALLRFDGAQWSHVGTGFTAPTGVDPFVADLAIFDDGGGAKLYAGGAFNSAGGVAAPGIARWNGSAWQAVPGVPAAFPGVSDFTVFDDGTGAGARLFVVDSADDLWVYDAGAWTRVGFTEPYFTGARMSGFADLPGGSGIVVHGNFREVFEVGDEPAAIPGLTILHGCPRITSVCAGDGGGFGVSCPCGNDGAPGRGCENSAGTGGALLTSAGVPSLASDSLVLTSSGERPTTLSIFLQGTVAIAPTNYGDGLRCTGGALKRLYTRNAAAGTVTAPIAGDPSISARSAALGNAIAPEATRFYQVYYRDPIAGFCPGPQGGTFNVSGGLKVVWAP